MKPVAYQWPLVSFKTEAWTLRVKLDKVFRYTPNLTGDVPGSQGSGVACLRPHTANTKMNTLTW